MNVLPDSLASHTEIFIRQTDFLLIRSRGSGATGSRDAYSKKMHDLTNMHTK